MPRSYVDLTKIRRARAIAASIIRQLATGQFCGASGQRCERLGKNCCLYALTPDDGEVKP